MTAKTLKVEGMSCHHCEMSVREELEELDGVESARADHTTGDVEVSYDERLVTHDRFREAIEEAGYSLRSI